LVVFDARQQILHHHDRTVDNESKIQCTPRLMRLAEMPNTFMPMSATAIDTGIASATKNAARMLPRNRKRISTTIAGPLAEVLHNRLARLHLPGKLREYNTCVSTSSGSGACFNASSAFSATSRLFWPESISTVPSTVSSPL
jgi:hypothetical protein